jgi:AhpD family alkylhydroperoxidase
MNTTTSIDYRRWAPGFEAMEAFDRVVNSSGLEPLLLELLQVRVSQLNRCAYCIDVHTKEARAKGETEQRLYGLATWRSAPFYSDRERAALALAEEETRVATGDISDEVLAEARLHFNETELLQVMYTVACINAWNRLALAGRFPKPGSYVPTS